MKRRDVFFWLTVSAVYLMPMFFIPGLGLVDDAQSILIAQDFLHLDVVGMAGWFREVTVGRFRPFYSIAMALFGFWGPHRPFFWAILRWLLLSGTILLGEMLFEPYLGNKKRKLILLAAFLWPAWAANMYRFGTAEPIRLFFLLLALVSLSRGQKQLPVLAWLAALWTKETTLFFTPLILWWQWWHGSSPGKKKIALSIGLLMAALVTYFLIPPVAGYSQNVTADFRQWLHIAFVHAPVAWPETYFGLALSLALWSMVLGDTIKSREPLKKLLDISGVFVAPFLAFFSVIIWRLPQERYLLDADFFLTLSLGVAAVQWWQRFVKRRRKYYWYLAVATLLLVLIPPRQWFRSFPAMTIRSGREIDSWAQNFSRHGVLSKWLATTSFERIYVDTDQEEFAYAIGLYASRFQPGLTGLTVISRFQFLQPIYRQSSSVLEAYHFECNARESCILLTVKE